ncbi:DUF6283 family protein [Micromonospora fluostatini]|uniref:DUF6283 family protein n=1 Tax=Micromonospora sp. JCM 30529 TaxID=3421643 RepID=UPI003D17B85C
MNHHHTGTRRPAPAPCRSCPYRRDVPSGVWATSEYAKLPDYDNPTALQPAGLFLCHQADGRVCAGWAGCHNGRHLLALRLAGLQGMHPDEVTATRDYTTTVPLFASGAEAAAHGLTDIDDPDPRARQVIDRLTPTIAARTLADAVRRLPVPYQAADGDCLTWAPATADLLTDLGHPAQVIQVAGWTDQQVIVFVHRTVLVTGGDRIVDVTAGQFDATLPRRWLTGWRAYRATLARAAGVARVTRWPDTT